MTAFEIMLNDVEEESLHAIIEVIQYADPKLSIDDCIKLLFVRGCNDFLAAMQKLGLGKAVIE